MKKAKTIFILSVLCVIFHSCSGDKSQKFVGNWVAAKEQTVKGIELKKVGENFLIVVAGYENFSNTASYDKEHDKLVLSSAGNIFIGGEILFNPDTKTIILNGTFEFKKAP